MDKQTILNDQQTNLRAELSAVYGIDPEEIMFFSNDPNPFLSYEATCTMLNKLVNFHDIDISPVPSALQDSLTLKCTLIHASGLTRSACGAVNLNEMIDGVRMSDTQMYALASARAIRNALRTAGIDLLKLHLGSDEVLDPKLKLKSNRNSLIAQAHILGGQAGLIYGDDKSLWYRLLKNRYGVNNSSELSEDFQLPDFVAFLKSLASQEAPMYTGQPTEGQAAAA